MLLFLAASFAQAELSARVDRQKISVDDTFTLVVSSTSMSIFDSPELSVLEQDFEVLGTSRNSQHSIINGKSKSSLEWHISLAPKRVGALVIPPIEVDGESTQPVVVEVVESSLAQSNPGFEPVFMQSEVDTDSVYVQSQLIFTVRIYYAIALARGAQLSELEIPNAVVKQLNEAAYETRVRNMNYNVHEVKYAIFPQRSGELKIPAQTFSARVANRRSGNSIFDNFGGSSRGGRSIRARSEAHSIDVKPQAQAFQGKHWLPAQKINIIETWSKELDELKAGEPITRTLIVEAVGLQGSQVPPLDIAELSDAQQYPDQPETADEDSSLGVTGTRIESQAIIPAGGGRLHIPEVKLPWWNTRSNRQEFAIVPAQTLTVSGAALVRPAPAPSAQAAAAPATEPLESSVLEIGKDSGVMLADGVSSWWKYATWFTVLLWLATVAYFLGQRRGKPQVVDAAEPAQTAKDALAGLQRACEQGDPLGIKSAVIEWARAHSGRPNISALSNVAAQFGDESLEAELKALDAALYQPGVQRFDAGRLMQVVQGLEENKKKRKRSGSRDFSLGPLYKA